jgi:hypothetical protein
MEFGPVVTTVVGVRAGDEMRLRYAWLRGEREFLAVGAQGDLVLDLEGPGPDTLGLNQGDRTSLTWVASLSARSDLLGIGVKAETSGSGPV